MILATVKAYFDEMDAATRESRALMEAKKPILATNALYRAKRLHAKATFELSKLSQSDHIKLAGDMALKSKADVDLADILITFNGRINQIV